MESRGHSSAEAAVIEMTAIDLPEIIEEMVMMESVNEDETSSDQQGRSVIPRIRIRIGLGLICENVAVRALSELPGSIALQASASDGLLRLPIDRRLSLDRTATANDRRGLPARCLCESRQCQRYSGEQEAYTNKFVHHAIPHWIIKFGSVCDLLERKWNRTTTLVL
jgi:hypothetical protein